MHVYFLSGVIMCAGKQSITVWNSFSMPLNPARGDRWDDMFTFCVCVFTVKNKKYILSWSYCSLNLRFCHLEPGSTPCISGCMQKELLEGSQFSRLTFQKLPGAKLPWSIAIFAWRTHCQIGRPSQISRLVGCSLYRILIYELIILQNRLNCIVLFINVIIHTDMCIFC